jgi:hypothetical protein
MTETGTRALQWTAAGVALFAFLLYASSLAPGLTWSHQGADGGELVAAAVVNGVPHPPGYPLYMLVLQAWLWASGLLWPQSDLAWRGNLLSALVGASSAGLTVLVAGHLLSRWGRAWLWAGFATLGWALTPLLWEQAVITEVYALHALLFVFLGWAVLVKPLRLCYVVTAVALGVAHHLTFLLLLPAAFYGLGRRRRGRRGWLNAAGVICLGIGIGSVFYVRTPLVAGAGPPPVNWGYATDWSGFWWLVSGSAYRGYFLDADAGVLLSRFAAWAGTVATWYTPVGLALALVGLAWWDRHAPVLRTFSLLWLAPVSLYAIMYRTRDSEIYLLPVAWIMALWLAVGLAAAADWVAERLFRSEQRGDMWFAGLVGIGLMGLLFWRWPSTTLGRDREAQEYLARLEEVLEPGSLLVTLDDRETFAVWYGMWGSGTLAARRPGVIPVNESLYQFEWYRRLLEDLFPTVPEVGVGLAAVIEANRRERPIYFAHIPATFPADGLVEVEPIWKLAP